MIKKDWFRVKKYPHIGLPIIPKDRIWVDSLVKNPNAIAEYGFYPFIHKTISVRKFRKVIADDGKRSKLREVGNKVREIYYANHLDSNIYSFYSELLNKKYESKLQEKDLQDCVIAYRRIPLNSKRNKCNVDFAMEVFEYIKKRPEDEIVAITFDIKSFFDNLDHKLLKKAWCNILNVKSLEKDHYNIYKNITKFSFVEEKRLFKEFKNSIIVETKSGIKKNRKIDQIKYLRNKGAIAYCETKDFDQRIRKNKLIINNKYNKDTGEVRGKGIPQGSPISSTLANIYLLDFDKKIKSEVKNRGGIYKRYSDDMIVVCESLYEDYFISLLKNEIKSENNKLDLQEKKTQIFIFKKENGRFKCYQKHGQILKDNKNFEYLGFEFDGKYTTLRSASLSSFFRKMKRSLKKCHYYAIHTKNKRAKGKIFKTRLYKRFSHLGSERRIKYTRDKNDSTKWRKTTKYDWGNYLSYTLMAERIIPDNKIKKQLNRHWNILNYLIKEKEKNLNNIFLKNKIINQ